MLGKHWIWLALAAVFVLEGTWLKWIIPPDWQSQLYVVPHFLLILAFFVAIYVNRHQGLLLGLVFGFLQDVVYYGHALGVYAFSMGLACYLVGLAGRRRPDFMVYVMIVITGGYFLYQLLVFGLYRYFLKVIFVEFQWMFPNAIVPSLLLNLFFALVVYVPVRKLLELFELSPAETASH